tara:strand:+ start:228 stop:944 length:717 start_codon:yes stop_codon:yes gene_type:complete
MPKRGYPGKSDSSSNKKQKSSKEIEFVTLDLQFKWTIELTEKLDVDIFGSLIVGMCEKEKDNEEDDEEEDEEDDEEGVCMIYVPVLPNPNYNSIKPYVLNVKKTMDGIIEYLKYHVEYGAMKGIEKPTLRNQSIESVTSEWDAEYISKFVNNIEGMKPLWDLINMANYFGVQPLVSLATLKAAKAVEDAVIKDKEASSLSSSTSSSLTNVQQLQLQPTSHITKAQVLQDFSWIEDRIL